MGIASRSLKTHIVLPTLLILAVGVVVAVTSVLAVRSGTRLGKSVPVVQAAADLLVKLTAVDEAAAKLTDARISDPAQRRALIDGAEAALAGVDASSRALAGAAGGAEHAALWRELEPLRDAWRQKASALLALQRKKDDAGSDPAAQLMLDAQAMETFVAMSESHRSAQVVVAKLVDRDAAAAGELSADASATLTRGAWVTLLACLAGLAALAFSGFAVQRSIRQTAAALVGQSDALCAAVTAGDLDRRAREEGVAVEFRSVVAGMNRILDAVVGPLRVTAGHVARIGRGDVPAPIDAPWAGELGALRDDVNRCSAAVSALLSDMQSLTGAALDGRVGERGDAARHQGDFGKVVQQVNSTLDALLAPVDEATAVLGRLAERDLCARMAGSYRGDHATMKQALNATAEALEGALAQVSAAAGEVTSAVGQIASASHLVAEGASQQSSALTETRTRLDEMRTSTARAATNAKRASELASVARSSAGDGQVAMDGMGVAMQAIRASAESTSQIIKEVNEIAFQTNLLALNAAVEAARAGDAGRGFAVVAEEVRSLALRSKEAAQRTEELIRGSVQKTSEGEAVSRAVASKLGEIVGAVTQVAEIVGEISESAAEQASGIERVGRAAADMQVVTQQNAAHSVQSSSAATELASQAQELSSLVGAFRVSERASALRS
jgi:methyl-accepting chemotaxis protein